MSISKIGIRFLTTLLKFVAISGIILFGLAIYTENSTNLFYKIPGFKTEGQNMSEWCWVASIQMTEQNLSGNLITQSDIYREYVRSVGTSGNRFITIDVDSFCREVKHPGALRGNNTLPRGREDFYKKYFENKGYGSVQISPFNSDDRDNLWSTIKKNIFEHDPVIFNNISCEECSGVTAPFWNGHTFVITGFLEFENLRLLYIQDPWRPLCEGCNYYLDYDLLYSPNGKAQALHGSKAIFDFRKSGSGSKAKGLFRRIWAFLFSKPKEEKPQKNILSEEHLASLKNKQNTAANIIRISSDSLANNISSYLVLETNPTGETSYFSLRESGTIGFYTIDSYRITCFFDKPFSDEFTDVWMNYHAPTNDYRVSFNYNGSPYSGLSLTATNHILENPAQNITDYSEFIVII